MKRKTRPKRDVWDTFVHYQATWPYSAREKYRNAIAERLKALKALSDWRGKSDASPKDSAVDDIS